MAHVTIATGDKFLVVAPHDRRRYISSAVIKKELGMRWDGEMLIFACGVKSGLLENMGPWRINQDHAWDVVSRSAHTHIQITARY